MEFKKTSPHFIVNDRIRICCNDSCSQGHHLIRTFLRDILCPLAELILLYCDNQSAIAVTKNEQYHARMKHIDIWYHFIQESIVREIIEVRYCPTQNMIVNIFTKALPIKTFKHLPTLLGVYLD